MLDVQERDGHGRIASWQAPDGRKLTSPALLWPNTSLWPIPAQADAVLAAEPITTDKVTLLSGGTWFHPIDAKGPLVVPAVQPVPSTQVQVLSVGDELAIFHDAAGWASNPAKLIPAWIDAKAKASPGRLLWAPGLGTPDDYALWVYLGVDIFDAMVLQRAALRGTILTTDGPLTKAEAEATFGRPLPDAAAILALNMELAKAELRLIAQRIKAGTLRAHVERRAYVKPATVETLRRFDQEHRFLESGSPHHRVCGLPCMTSESLWGPEVVAFRRAFQDRYVPPKSARILVLLPCSQGKPYKLSRSHRILARVLESTGLRASIHEVMLTSPLGLVPRELEETYPACQYDVPVTGRWTADEEEVIREQLASLLENAAYDAVIVHTGQSSFDLMRDLLPDTTLHTCLSHPTSHDDLERLRAAILAASPPKVDWPTRRLDDMRSLLSFQFGRTIADDLTAGAATSGRPPYVRLEREGLQLATTTPDRGIVSLTREGAKALDRHKAQRVFIGDFTPKKTSTLFAVGVTGADPDVRAGDEVVVVKPDGTIVGNGVAQMSAAEMTHLKRGSAVNLRHLEAKE